VICQKCPAHHTHTHAHAQDGLEFYHNQWENEIQLKPEEREEHWREMSKRQGLFGE